MGISHNIIDMVSWKSCCLFNMGILQMINYEMLTYYYNRFRITVLVYKYEICFDCCFKKMFQLEKEFQLSNTSQCNVFQTQNFIFCFELVNTKTMQYLPSMFLVNKMKFLHILFVLIFQKQGKKIYLIYLYCRHVNHRMCYIACMCVGMCMCNRTHLMT